MFSRIELECPIRNAQNSVLSKIYIRPVFYTNESRIVKAFTAFYLNESFVGTGWLRACIYRNLPSGNQITVGIQPGIGGIGDKIH